MAEVSNFRNLQFAFAKCEIGVLGHFDILNHIGIIGLYGFNGLGAFFVELKRF
jgi:hypothetical protein